MHQAVDRCRWARFLTRSYAMLSYKCVVHKLTLPPTREPASADLGIGLVWYRRQSLGTDVRIRTDLLRAYLLTECARFIKEPQTICELKYSEKLYLNVTVVSNYVLYVQIDWKCLIFIFLERDTYLDPGKCSISCCDKMKLIIYLMFWY